MDPHVTITIIVAVFGVAAAVGRYYSGVRFVPSQPLKAPCTPIAAFPTGDSARIAGTVKALATVTAPLSGRPCVYFEAVVEEYRGSGRGGDWLPVAREVKVQPFLVTDRTGCALVDPAVARLLLLITTENESGLFSDPSPSEAAFLARHVINSATWIGVNKRLRYQESVITEGDLVTVAGKGVRELDPDAGWSGEAYRDAPTRLVLRGTAESPLRISDRL